MKDEWLLAPHCQLHLCDEHANLILHLYIVLAAGVKATLTYRHAVGPSPRHQHLQLGVVVLVQQVIGVVRVTTKSVENRGPAAIYPGSWPDTRGGW